MPASARKQKGVRDRKDQEDQLAKAKKKVTDSLNDNDDLNEEL